MSGVLVPKPGDRALTIRQPWASLIMAEIKTVENRSWAVPSTLPCTQGGDHAVGDGYALCSPFPFRLWVHAGATYDDSAWLRWHHDTEWSHAALPSPMPPSHPTRDYPMGVLLGSVLVTGCHHADDERVLRREGYEGHPVEYFEPCSPWAEPNAFHWTLTDPQPLPEPIPMKGRQGLWRLPADVEVPA